MRIKPWHFAFAALLASVTTPALPQAPVVIKFSHIDASDTPKGKAAERFKELAEKSTKGRVRIELYPGSRLYADKEEIDALQLGAVQMLAPSLSKFSMLGMREFELFDLPYLFPGRAAVYRITEGPTGRDLLKKLDAKGMTGLTFWDEGFKVMTANHVLRSPSDFKGLRMRIQPSKVLEAQMNALGALPQSMASGDVHQALVNGAADGTENTPVNLVRQHISDAQRHLTVSNHGYLGYAVIVNKKFWESLPAGLRDTLEESLREATEYNNALAQKKNEEALEQIRKSGKTHVHMLSEADRQEWRRALAPVQRQMAGRIGPDLLDAVQKEINATEGR